MMKRASVVTKTHKCERDSTYLFLIFKKSIEGYDMN